MDLLAHLMRDAAATISLGSSSLEHDIVTLQTRTQSEGLAFMTRVLPSLGKSLDKALSSDTPLKVPAGFVMSKKDPWPVFLSGYWRCILDESGQVNVAPTCKRLQVNAVRAVRQICYLVYKLEGSHTPQSELDLLDSFVATDKSLPLVLDEGSLSTTTRRALENARQLLARLFCNEELQDILPKHGPGAVATGEKYHGKMKFSRFFESLDQEYPYSDFFFFSYSHLCDDLESLEALKHESAPTAKVVLVPKDSRGPRIISMEPLEIQWIQQGILAKLVRLIEQKGSITSGFVNFTRQEINRELALSSSEDGVYDTLDMKDASDRVSVALVDSLFPPHITCKLMAARSTHTKLPNGSVIELRKFAPMGSAVCFPVEALTFWALALGTLLHKRIMAPSGMPEVFVYGDDIVVRKGDFAHILPVFEELHLQFNKDKCCVGRFFRESCGCDAFRLEDVTPLRLKKRWEDISSPATALSYVSVLRALKERGLWGAAEFLQTSLASSLGCLPRTNRERAESLPYAIYEPLWSSAMVRDYNRSNFRHRFSKRYHREELFVPTPAAPSFRAGEPDWSELLRLAYSYFSEVRVVSEAAMACRHTASHAVKLQGRWVEHAALLS